MRHPHGLQGEALQNLLGPRHVQVLDNVDQVGAVTMWAVEGCGGRAGPSGEIGGLGRRSAGKEER